MVGLGTRLGSRGVQDNQPLLLLAIVSVAALVTFSRRGQAPWAKSFRLYLLLALFIVVLRVAFRIIFGGVMARPSLFTLPEVPLPTWVRGIRLLGPVSAEAMLYGFYDGARLATIVVCVGAANSLANPKKLLASMPAALYELGTIMVVAVSALPQLAESLQRVVRARRLRRPAPGKGRRQRLRAVETIIVPVLSDALERSLKLAASMDVRGYGRTGPLGARDRLWGVSFGIASMMLLAVWAFRFLSHTSEYALFGVPVVSTALLVGGLGSAIVALRASGRNVHRTRYRPIRWRLADGDGVVRIGRGCRHHVGGDRRRCLSPVSLDHSPRLAGTHPSPVAGNHPRRAPRIRHPSARRGQPMIRLDDVSFRYNATDPLRLSHVSFEIDEGELCLVVGPTGSGKSTLLGCINNLVPRFTGGVRTGEIWLDGHNTTRLQPRELATTVGYVGQDPLAGFVTDTVEEELAYSMEQLGFAPAEMRRRVEETMDLLGIADLRKRALTTLSGGQQQRVAIGSVLASSPRILVLDEPTSALDPVAAEEVLALVSRLVRDLGTTVVVAEHRMERVIEFADSVLLVGDDVRHANTRAAMTLSPIKPPLVELGVARSWEPLPLTIREGRRAAAAERRSWNEAPPLLPEPATPGAMVLEASGIIVRYGHKVAVADVDLRLHSGQVTALMGRNGSGKSSLMWALHGAGKRDAGTVSLDESIALVPQTPSDLLYLPSVEAECATADQNSGLPQGTTLTLLQRLVPGIAPSSHPRDLSEGQKLAVVLAVELVGNPGVVLLDEPTRGIDYAAKAALSEIIAGMAAEGRAILIATHDVELVATTCDRVVVMAEGEVVSDGPTRQVLAGSALLATQVAKVSAPTPILTVQEFLDAAR